MRCRSAAHNGGLRQAGALQDQRPTLVVGTLRVLTDPRNPHTESAGHKLVAGAFHVPWLLADGTWNVPATLPSRGFG